MNDTIKKTSILGIISLIMAILAGICFPVFKVLAIWSDDDVGMFVGAFLAGFIAMIGTVIGGIAVFRVRTRHGITGLLLNILLFVVGVSIILIGFVNEILRGMSAIH